MLRRWITRSRTSVLILLGAGAVVAILLQLRPAWRTDTLREVTRLPSLDAELFFVDASTIVERGPGRALVLRFHRDVELVPYHYRDIGLDQPATIDQWRRELGVAVVINAGQYDEYGKHLGWLKGQSRWLSRAFRRQWKALLVSAPVDGSIQTTIIDLESTDAAVAKSYDNVVQSMMLVDRERGVRVRKSELTACRTVIAEDADGRMLFVITEGAVTLHRLARWLIESDLNIVRAMNLDGGLESQFALETDEASVSLYGQYGSGTEAFDAGAGPLRRPLPAVIGVRRQQKP